MQKVSKYQYCNDCFRFFILSNMVQKYKNKNENLAIHCIYCRSTNTCNTTKKSYENWRKRKYE